MAAQRLILVRHSLPEVDLTVPADSWQLSEEGRRRCEPLADALALLEPTALFSSPVPRALETASILADRLQLTVTSVDDLQEHRGRGPPMASPEALEERLSQFFAQPDRVIFGDESANEVERRLHRVLEAAVNDGNGTSVVVSHRTIIVSFVSSRTGLEPMALWRRLDAPSFVVLSRPDYGLVEIREFV